MKVIICGGREFDNYDAVKETMDAVVLHYGDVTAVVQGGARGADLLGRKWAIENNIPYEQYDADWARYGKAAGFMRNQEMLEESGANLVVAFPGGNGTYDMVKRARRHGVEIVNVSV